MATTIVASVGNIPDETGLAVQQHLIYATNQGRWWCFWADAADTTHIKVRVSSSNDLSTATWSDPTNNISPALTTGVHGNSGPNLSVGYKSISSTDVIHLAVDTATAAIRYYIRATISGATTITWGSWIGFAASNTAYLPSGAGIGFSSDGHVFHGSAYLGNTGNQNANASTNADAGSSWTSGFGASVQVKGNINICHSNVLFDVGSTNMLVLADDAAGTGNNMTDVVWAKSSGTTWTANSAAAVFGSSADQDYNDWGACALSTTDVHCVRRTGSTALTHRRYNGTSWSAGNTIPSTGLTGHLAASGVFLANDGTSVWCFVIDTDANHNVKYVKWTSGSGWDSSWSTLTTNTNTKNKVSGFLQAVNLQINVIWTEGSSSPFSIVCASLSTAGGATTAYRDSTVRIRVAATAFKDAVARVRVAVRAFRDATARIRVAATAFKDSTARVRVAATAYRDATARIRTAATAFKDATARVRTAATAFKDATVRIVVTAPGATTAYKFATARIRVAATAFKDATVRAGVRVQAYRDATARIRVVAPGYRDATARIRTAVRAFKDATLRVGVRVGSFKDAALRVRVVVRGYRDASLRIGVDSGIPFRNMVYLAGPPASAWQLGNPTTAWRFGVPEE